MKNTNNHQGRIIITGGSGFIGQFLINRFCELNYTNLVILDRKTPKSNCGDFFSGDFYDKELLNKIIKPNDIIIHLACSTIPQLSEDNREKDIIENTMGTVKLLEVCAEKKVDKFIFLSSGGTIYGDIGKIPAKEIDPTLPVCSHGVMKLTIEKYIQVFKHLYDLDYLILRVANPYGYSNFSNRQQGVIDVFLKKIIDNKNIEIWGDGKISRDFIHIDDLINFIIEALNNDIRNEIINVGTGEAASINNILSIIKKVTNQELDVKYLKSRDVDVQYNVLNISKAKNMINWEPKITIEEGIKRTFLSMTK